MVVVALCCSLYFLAEGGSKARVAARGHAHNTREGERNSFQSIGLLPCTLYLSKCNCVINSTVFPSFVLPSFCSRCNSQNVGCQKSTASLSQSGKCQCFSSWMRWSCSRGRHRERSHRGAGPGIHTPGYQTWSQSS